MYGQMQEAPGTGFQAQDVFYEKSLWPGLCLSTKPLATLITKNWKSVEASVRATMRGAGRELAWSSVHEDIPD